jgi:hypothetical protein
MNCKPEVYVGYMKIFFVHSCYFFCISYCECEKTGTCGDVILFFLQYQ